MMESSNLNLDLHHQEELHGSSSSSSLAATSFHFVGTNHEWNQDLLLNINSGDFIPNTSGVLSSSKDFMRLSHEIPMVQDLGFQSLGGNGEGYMNSHSSHQAHLSKIREELSDSFSKLSGINLRDPSNLHDYHLMPSHVKNELDQINGLQPASGDFGFDPMNLGCFGRGSFSMVLPTANISNSNQPPLQYSGMDLQALDLLASARLGRTLCQPSLHNMSLLREDLAYGLGQLKEPAQGPSASHHKISPSVTGVTETKRGNNSLEYKASQTAAKKPRFESRSSFTPFKVRKEKLGDRIAALQQLVAPFGKTDTASVLMEAIGYIKFLQDQVETLSVPYMRSSNNKKLRALQGASSEEMRDEPRPDLRSRGLCLVPLSCTSYVTNENGGVWSPPNYRGGT